MTERYVPDDGRYDDLDNEVYHHLWDAWNMSRFKSIARSPAHCRHMIDNPQRGESAIPAFRYGSALHCAVLEPERFEETYRLDPMKPDSVAAYPPGWRNTKAYREAKADLVERGFSVLSQHDFDACRSSRDLLWNEKGHHQEILQAATGAEVSFALKVPGTELLGKIRPDLLAPNIHVDLKTTESLERFKRDLYGYGYHVGAAFYQYMLTYHYPGQFGNHFFLAIENSAPFEFQLFQLDPEAMALGQRKVERLIEVASKCVESNEWPGYPREVQCISLPGYAYTQEEETA